MKPTGCTIEAYKPLPKPAIMAKLRTMVDDLRFISHNDGTSWMFAEGLEGPCRLWDENPAYMATAREVFGTYGFRRFYDTLNCKALPWHGERWVNDAGQLATTQTFDASVFVPWVKAYVRRMATQGVDYRLVFGNEPDADDGTGSNIYLHDEYAFRLRYALLVQAVEELEADDTFRGKVSLGAGGWVQDWARAGVFVAWCKDNGIRLDFVDVHIYQDPSRLAAARDAIGPDMPIAILESGAEWDHTIKPPTAPKQKAWFRGMDKATDADGNVIAWHIMHGAGASNVQALALMGARGALTPLGKMAA